MILLTYTLPKDKEEAYNTCMTNVDQQDQYKLPSQILCEDGQGIQQVCAL